MESTLGFPSRPPARPTLLTIGSFDGVHLGHQTIIRNLVASARRERCLAGLLTFDPHPMTVLRPERATPRLTSIAERAEFLAALGLDFMVVLPFTRETATTMASDFVRDLVEHLSLKTLWIGPDFALGRGREGNATRLSELGALLGYDVNVIEPFELDGGLVRSSRIRALLAESGAVDVAAQLLGRSYQVWGRVVRGAQRGRTLGFPTANLQLPPDRLIPAFGVYACWAWRSDAATDGLIPGCPAVVNIGVRPSFDNGKPSVEAFLLDFDDDLYDETLGLSFVRRLRGEQRFSDIGALIAQIQADADQARAILSDPGHGGEAGGQPAWEELPHIADWAIRVRGASQRELFAGAAAAMAALQSADPAREITLARAVKAEGENPSQLLVAWLNALLLGQDVGRELHTQFEVQEISETGLRAVAYGYHGHPEHTAIKATTYYDLDVTQSAEGWSATVTFDV
jgi:riboflavin kinase/FMN adenylyltransferase